MSDAILFAGPSLAGWTPSAGIALRPPATAGDLLRAAAERPPAIGLVDGVFETAPAVGHKEILQVMAAGIPVLGAASLGALRAAELDGYGMIGVGDIYEAYRSGRVTRDDAVMVLHAPAALGHRPLTVALVDVYAVLDAAPLSADAKAGLRRIAGQCDFRTRTWEALRDRYGAFDPALLGERFSQKQRDAIALTERLARGDFARPAPPTIPQTCYLEALVRRVGLTG